MTYVTLLIGFLDLLFYTRSRMINQELQSHKEKIFVLKNTKYILYFQSEGCKVFNHFRFWARLTNKGNLFQVDISQFLS